ncbi:hypothetical protein [Streptomyces sp. NPDC086023]|uniref:hypothetical protein n=1 Tax=Streptomyces sp. NPDC086023 TaxID=3365746 RepID=UPI0037D31B2C
MDARQPGQFSGVDGTAQLLAVVTPTYLSAATYGVIGDGRSPAQIAVLEHAEELTPRLVPNFAALLGVPPPPAPEVADAAALLWEARRLSAAQAKHVSELARSMRGDSSEGYLINLPGS